MAKLTRLKDVRQRKALTQRQLAERAGVNRVTIARIETGKDEPFPTTVRKVADALGVEPEELLDPVAESAVNGPSTVPANGPATHLSLDERITVVDEEDVRRLLSSEPDLLPLVNEAAEQLSRFIPDASLRLEYVVDPEYGEPEQLFLGAWTNLDMNEALKARRRFDQEWGVPNARRRRGLLIIDLR